MQGYLGELLESKPSDVQQPGDKAANELTSAKEMLSDRVARGGVGSPMERPEVSWRTIAVISALILTAVLLGVLLGRVM